MASEKLELHVFGKGSFNINAAAELERMFHKEIVASIRNGTPLPEEIADLLKVTPMGRGRYRIEMA